MNSILPVMTAAVITLASTAQASVIDLSDNGFASVTYGSAGPIIAFTEVVDGVTFTFAAAGQFRNVGTWDGGIIKAAAPWGLSFGGGGINTASWTLTASADVTLNSYNGEGPLNTGNIIPIFDVTGAGVSSPGNTFTNYGAFGGPGIDYSFAAGPLSLSAGESYLFNTTNNSSNTLGHIYSLDFTRAEPVPLPAGLPLLAAGLAALGWMRRRRG